MDIYIEREDRNIKRVWEREREKRERDREREIEREWEEREFIKGNYGVLVGILYHARGRH